MIKIENWNVYNFKNAMRGMRHPKLSYIKNDTEEKFLTHYALSEMPEYAKFVRTSSNSINLCTSDDEYEGFSCVYIGDNDLKLIQSLIRAGKDHRKALRQILVSMEITTSMSTFWDLDTYTVGVTKNSSSRMHCLGNRHVTYKDFDWDEETDFRTLTIDHINDLIDKLWYMKEEGKGLSDPEYYAVWKQMMNDLPDGFVFTRTWTGNYEVLTSCRFARRFHKDKNLRDFCKFIEDEFPYAKQLICYE